MKFKKGSKEAREFMAKLRASKGKSKKKLSGTKKKVVKKKAKKVHTDVKSHNYKISISGLFYTDTIKDIDSLKKQYRDLALKYHPDAGGTHLQFIELKKEYDQLFKQLLNNSNFNKEQKENEIKLDEAMQNAVDCLILLPNIKIEIVGKWIWVSGETYPIKTELKKAGLTFIKKAGEPFWVFKGVESSGRGKMNIEEIKNKYGVHTIQKPSKKTLSGMIPKINKAKLKKALSKITKSLNKRPI